MYNELVCNCHEDSKLLDVIGLVERVYQADTQTERVKYGRRLQKAIKSFLEEFLHHMDEEESIFQPLLVENFNSKELKDMKEVVQRQHSFFREKVKSEKSLKALKRKRSDAGGKPQQEQLDFSLEDLRFRKSYCQEVSDFLKKNSPQEGASCSTSGIQLDQDQDEGEIAAKKSKLSSLQPCYIDQIPEELLVLIFSNLGPQALINCGAVNKRWRQVAYSSVFWKAMYPTQWARGQWSFDFIAPDLKSDDELMANMSSLSSVSSSLSSSIESLPDEEEPAEGNNNQISSGVGSTSEEGKIFLGIGHFLLPKVGNMVSKLILSASKTLNDDHVNLLLSKVPNVRTVNLSYTQITSEAFKGLHEKKHALRNIEELFLQGCTRVGDSLFYWLKRCFPTKTHPRGSKLRRLNLSGCRSITSLTLDKYLMVHAKSLQELDLSGCYKIDGETLSLFVGKCIKLRPERLAYCNDIEDGPFPDTANGCLNLECELRFCCQKLKN